MDRWIDDTDVRSIVGCWLRIIVSSLRFRAFFEVGQSDIRIIFFLRSRAIGTELMQKLNTRAQDTDSSQINGNHLKMLEQLLPVFKQVRYALADKSFTTFITRPCRRKKQ